MIIGSDTMVIENYKNLGRDRINEILKQGWKQIEFIEIVFREWAKLNQDALDKDYTLQKGVPREDGDMDQFYLWLVDNKYLQAFCKSSDNTIVKEFCVEYFGYKDSDVLQK